MTTTEREALKAILLAAMETAREVAQEEETRLGRPLTDTEIRSIAETVERQLPVALQMARF